MRRAAQGAKSEQLQAGVEALDEGLARWVDEFVFGDVWQRPGLDYRERMLAAIASLAALKNHDQLRAYLFGALQAGVPVDAVREVLVMQVVYAGFPVAIQALSVWEEVLASAERSGLGHTAETHDDGPSG